MGVLQAFIDIKLRDSHNDHCQWVTVLCKIQTHNKLFTIIQFLHASETVKFHYNDLTKNFQKIFFPSLLKEHLT